MEKRGENTARLSHRKLSPIKKSQVAVEFIVLLSFIFVILIILFAVNQGILDSFTAQYREGKAKLAIDELTNAADQVYMQGLGARTRVFITLPKGIAFSEIENRSIRISLQTPSGLNHDIYRSTSYQVVGFLPEEEGSHWVNIESEEGYVIIGYALIDVAPSMISKNIMNTSIETETITIRNLIDENVYTSISLEMDTGIAASLDTSNVFLEKAGEANILLTLSVPNTTLGGTYYGKITILANTTTKTQRQTIPIIVEMNRECLGNCPETCPGIQLYPETWEKGNITKNQLYMQTFYVCNNMNYTVTVSLSFSAGQYLGFNTDISEKNQTQSIDKKTCITTEVYLNSTSSETGSYTGLLYAATTDASDYSTISYIITNETQPNITSPIINLMVPIDNFTSRADRITFRYNLSGYTSASSCRLIINNRVNTTQNNIPVNTVKEINISRFTNGNYTWAVNCTGNSTPSAEGLSETRRFVVSILTIYVTPAHVWEEDYDPTWYTAEFERINDAKFSTITDEIDIMPDYIEIEFPSINLTHYHSIKAVVMTLTHLEDLRDGFFNEDPRHQVDCYNGAGWVKIGTWDYSETDWVNYITPNLYSCINTISNANDMHMRFYYDPAYGTGGIQYIDFIQMQVNYSINLYPNLWAMAINNRSPVDFTSGLNTTANTFGRSLGDDGWDWAANTYGGTLTAASINIDPNMDSNTADSTVAADKRLKIILGGGTPGAQNDPADNGITGIMASAAYGIQFNITSEMIQEIAGGKIVNLAFDWVADADGGKGDELDSADEAWIKARLITPTQTIWLGSNQDGGDDDADANNELWFRNDPVDASGSVDLDITSYITQEGIYYLDLGGAIGDWDNANEAFGAYFDNIVFVIK